MKKRTWCYIMKPTAYQISCDLCSGDNLAWSEYEKMVWCFDCEKDTPGNGGIFTGPIPLEVCELLGISFDRIDLATGNRIKMRELEDRVEWPCSDPFWKYESRGGSIVR